MPDSPPGLVRLSNDTLAVDVSPAEGGKIAQVTDLRDAHTWFWRNPHLPTAARQTEPTADYGRLLDNGGWDEILLSVDATRVSREGHASLDIADHGDLVGRNADCEISDRQCSVTLAGSAASYRFERTITLGDTLGDTQRAGGSLTLDYRLTAETAMPWYWCAHPLLPLDASTRIHLPNDMPCRCEPGPEFMWPNADGIDLSVFGSAASGQATKVFAPMPAAGVRISSDAGSMHIQTDPEVIPWLALWVNDGGWSGGDWPAYRNLGVEPTTCRYDNAATAQAAGELAWLEAGEQRHWQLRVSFDR